MNNIKIFSHDDLDGIGCNIVAKILLPKVTIDCINCNYDNIDQLVKDFIINEEYKEVDKIYITDIRINEEVAELIEKTCKDKIKLLDHHPTALYLNKYRWATVQIEDDKEKVSGTKLFYDELIKNNNVSFNNSLFDFVEKIKRYDTWLWKEKYNDGKSKQLNDLFFILGADKFIDLAIKEINLNENVENFLLKYQLLLNIEQSRIDKYIKEKNKELIKRSFMEYNIGIIFADQYSSELGNRLSEMNPSCDFIMIIKGNGVSLRTNKDKIDCGKIAKMYGGGGHPKAAGFTVKDYIIGININNVLTATI